MDSIAGERGSPLTEGLDESRQPVNRLNAFVSGIQALPPTPALVTDLLAIFRKPDVDIQLVAKLIRHDPPIAAEVLRRCNSAYFRGAEPAKDVFDAVVRLGYLQIYRVVMAIAGSRTMRALPPGCGMEVETLWKHSFETAVAAGIIARQVKEPEGVAFTAGLLHDIGKIPLAMAAGPKYGMLAQMASIPGLTLVGVETDMFGFDHGAVGGRLLDRWQLPEDVAAAVRFHHDYLNAGQYTRLAAIIALADTMARSLKEQTEQQSTELAGCAPSMGHLQLGRETVLEMFGLVTRELEQDQAVMAVG